MLIRKTAPVGVDKLIDQLQVQLNTDIVLSNWESYPRAYKNPNRFNENGFIPESYTSNGDYVEVFYDDHFNLSSFWVVGERRTIKDGMITVDLSLIVQANLFKCLPSINHRADEELTNMFVNSLLGSFDNVKLVGVENGVDNVYREFIKNLVKFDDMGDHYIVRFNLNATLEAECCSNC
jgi:hypothetical protein